MQKRHTDSSLSYIEYVPSGSKDQPLPLLIFLHGRGSDAKDLAELAPALDGRGGYRFIFPDAPRPFEMSRGLTHGFSWFDGWPPSGDSMAISRQLLLKFIGEMVERYGSSLDRTILGGFSQGALMSLDAGFRLDSDLAGIVAMSGAMFEKELPDIRAHQKTPVLVVHGDSDDTIPVIAARRTRQLLASHGIEAEYEEFPMGHWVTAESMERVRAFVQQCLEK